MAVILHHGDAVEWARNYEGDLFHAAFCDAPYEMNFMNRDWDGSGVAFDPETWRAFAGVLHPGAFLFVFAGTINDDLISVAMREAGLRKFHKMQGWVYGSGFPKASRIDTQIDKAAGAEREVVGQQTVTGNLVLTSRPGWRKSIKGGFVTDAPAAQKYGGKKNKASFDITAPATDLARTWAGHRYGLQALKPAIETVLIFQKPYEGSPIDNITQTGAGALWVDGARIGTSKDVPASASGVTGIYQNGHKKLDERSGMDPNVGRWPANFYVECDCNSIDWCECDDPEVR